MLLKPEIRGILAAAMLLAVTAAAAGAELTNQVFAARAQTTFALARKNYLTDTNSTAAALALAHASFDFTDFVTNETQRAEIARCGIAACRQVLAREPRSAPGHYFLAMNLGELAQAEAPSIAAYKLVHEVEREFLQAAELDVNFDHAGPARSLGELYFEAPGWPFSVGSKHHAREWFERAFTLAPEYPGNGLDLAEAQLKWRQPEAFAATMASLASHWPAAKTNFTGLAWEPSWIEWNARRAALVAEAPKVFKSAP